jgi:hypothetical protein
VLTIVINPEQCRRQRRLTSFPNRRRSIGTGASRRRFSQQIALVFLPQPRGGNRAECVGNVSRGKLWRTRAGWLFPDASERNRDGDAAAHTNEIRSLPKISGETPSPRIREIEAVLSERGEAAQHPWSSLLYARAISHRTAARGRSEVTARRRRAPNSSIKPCSSGLGWRLAVNAGASGFSCDHWHTETSMEGGMCQPQPRQGRLTLIDVSAPRHRMAQLPRGGPRSRSLATAPAPPVQAPPIFTSRRLAH